MQEKGRILAIDLGLKKTGLAVSDELWISTRALKNLIPKSRSEDIAYLLKLIKELNVSYVLIGYATLTQSGEEGFMAKRARGFLENLQSLLPIGTEAFLVDEAYSSAEAEKRLKRQRKDTQNLIDGESARILIESFIYAKNN